MPATVVSIYPHSGKLNNRVLCVVVKVCPEIKNLSIDPTLCHCIAG